MADLLAEAEGIDIAFAGNRVLADVDLAVRRRRRSSRSSAPTARASRRWCAPCWG